MLTNTGVTLTGRALALAAFVTLLSGIGAYVVAQQGSAQSTRTVQGLAADDREQIRELMHRYMFYLDNCPDSNGGYDYADLFTEDGRYGVGDNRGRDALARASGRQPDGSCAPQRHRGPRTQIHLNVGEIIRPSPEGARATSYLLMVDGPGGQVYWDGWYEDILVKTAKGWRFKQRVHVGGARAGIPAAALQRRREIAEASAAQTLDPSVPVSRDPVKWVDGIDTRPLEQTPAYTSGQGRQGGPPPSGQTR
jgi:hypothetical protein